MINHAPIEGKGLKTNNYQVFSQLDRCAISFLGSALDCMVLISSLVEQALFLLSPLVLLQCYAQKKGKFI